MCLIAKLRKTKLSSKREKISSRRAKITSIRRMKICPIKRVKISPIRRVMICLIRIRIRGISSFYARLTTYLLKPASSMMY
jgi:hypothetical protein